MFQEQWWLGGGLVAAVAVAVLVAGEVWAAARVAARRWVVNTGSGLRWIGEPAEISVEDRQVTAVRLAYRHKYAAGIRKHTTRDFEVWIEGRSQPLRMSNRIAVGLSDPLAAAINRICNDLKERAAAGLASGQPLTGDDWSLRPAELTLRQGRTLVAVPFREIDKVGLFDDKLCIWCKGQDEPAARIAPGSRNAPVLGALLGEWVAHPSGGCGRASPGQRHGGAGRGRAGRLEPGQGPSSSGGSGRWPSTWALPH